MENAYNSPISAIQYLDFLASKNGEIQQKILYNAISSALPKKPDLTILDAGCGNGWLTSKLNSDYKNIQGCDASDFLIQVAKVNNKNINYLVTDLQHTLPYANNSFDAVILNMVLPDISNLEYVFKNVSKVLKNNSLLLATVPNPKYTYPKAEWKRSLLNIILGQKPKLKINKALVASGKIKREYNKNSFINSYYYSLSDYILSAQGHRLELFNTIELKPIKQSENFDLNYQLAQYPLLLLLCFKKI